jgi:phage-related protein
MKKLFILLVPVMMIGLTACNANEPTNQGGSQGSGSGDQSEKITLNVKPSEITFNGFHMQTEYINIECNTNWTVEIENNKMFQSVSPSYYGNGNRRMSVTVPEINSQNQSSFSTQNGSITISCKDENHRTLSKTVKCTRKKY